MYKPSIESMDDKVEVLNPDGSFRCYSSLTFDKLKDRAADIEIETQLARDSLLDEAESDETSTGESFMWTRLGLISIQVMAFVSGSLFWFTLTEFIEYGYLGRHGLSSILALPSAVIILLLPHLLRSLDDEYLEKN